MRMVRKGLGEYNERGEKGKVYTGETELPRQTLRYASMRNTGRDGRDKREKQWECGQEVYEVRRGG